mmetsp:Transcript_28014/g.63312  ORF Transcript_28014/g.63312 Transcript_28014/m.63312 type:complete len:245 (-) Transcript_28014:230-964(-)
MGDFPAIVRLSVGGIEHVTSLTTLRRFPDSMLATMFAPSREWEGERLLTPHEDNGHYFIDRQGDIFSYVLEYLRCGTLELPAKLDDLRRLEREADFFMLPGLKDLVRTKLLQVNFVVNMYSMNERDLHPDLCCVARLHLSLDTNESPTGEFEATEASMHAVMKTIGNAMCVLYEQYAECLSAQQRVQLDQNERQRIGVQLSKIKSLLEVMVKDGNMARFRTADSKYSVHVEVQQTFQRKQLSRP